MVYSEGQHLHHDTCSNICGRREEYHSRAQGLRYTSIHQGIRSFRYREDRFVYARRTDCASKDHELGGSSTVNSKIEEAGKKLEKLKKLLEIMLHAAQDDDKPPSDRRTDDAEGDLFIDSRETLQRYDCAVMTRPTKTEASSYLHSQLHTLNRSKFIRHL